MIQKLCCSRFSLHRLVHLKFFGTQFKNVHLRGLCSSRLCISRPYCMDFFPGPTALSKALRLLIFGIFARSYIYFHVWWGFCSINLHILFMPYVYSRPYVYSIWQIFHALRLFPALRLFQTLEYVPKFKWDFYKEFGPIVLWWSACLTHSWFQHLLKSQNSWVNFASLEVIPFLLKQKKRIYMMTTDWLAKDYSGLLDVRVCATRTYAGVPEAMKIWLGYVIFQWVNCSLVAILL